MLKQLYIKNFTLIDELNIGFRPGFSVITGETGAGKSIILGALQLLLGQRADSRQIKSGCSKCVVEAHFDLSNYQMEEFFKDNDIDYYADDCIIRRELKSDGKSRGFINDSPVSLTVMRNLGNLLIDIHSQHQNLLLQKEDFQLEVVDIIAGDRHELKAYQEAYAGWLKARKTYEDFETECRRNRENADYLRFQFNELDSARLKAGEDEVLEQQSKTLSHAEEIKSALFDASAALSADETGSDSLTRKASDRLNGIAQVFPDIQEAAARLDSVCIELRDIASEIGRHLSDIDFDPQQLDDINGRLDLIYALEQKFHAASVNELLDRQNAIRQQLESIDNGDERLAELQQAADRAFALCNSAADKLTAIRHRAARTVESEMRRRLIPLGIPKVQFSIAFSPRECSPKGKDKIAFLFSANSSTPLNPIAQVASGGEIARVMLSLKAMISGAVRLPTIIFDEIDTGVSGRVAEKMAQIMREMGDNHRQVISITHLPQIAAMGTTHYKVSKEETAGGTVSHMTLLNDSQRVNELAQMLSGSDITEAAVANAKALLGQSKALGK